MFTHIITDISTRSFVNNVLLIALTKINIILYFPVFYDYLTCRVTTGNTNNMFNAGDST